MNRPRSFEEVQTMLNQLDSRLALLETQNIDLHQRRIVNAGNAVDKGDYITAQEVADAITDAFNIFTGQSGSTSSKPAQVSNNFTADIIITKTTPRLILNYPGTTTKTRVFQPAADEICIGTNLNWSGTAWVLDDAAKQGMLIVIKTSQVQFYNFPVSGTLTLIYDFQSTFANFINAPIQMNGLFVLGTRKTGWTVATGTATRTSFLTSSVTLPTLAEHVKALIDDLIAHGMIGT